MNSVTISITGVKQAPDWVTLEQLLRQSLGEENGILSRIARRDGGVDYQAPGTYDLRFTTHVDGVEVTLVVTR